MNKLVLGAFVLGAFGFGARVHAQESSAFHTGSCPESTGTNWCAPLLSNEGWRLRYKSESPSDLMDLFWRYEIWVKEKAAVACIFEGGRGGTRINRCQTLSEVDQ
jgi:hypothetical protein